MSDPEARRVAWGRRMDVLIAIAALILAVWFAALGLLSEGERERLEEEERRRREAPATSAPGPTGPGETEPAGR